MVYRAFKVFHLFALALLTGFMAVAQWSLVPAQNRLDAVGYATLEKGMNAVLEYLTPALMITALFAAVAVLAGARRRTRSVFVLYAVATACLVAMIGSTLLINAPINATIDGWNAAAPPPDWLELRDRWEFGHAIRSYIGLIGLLAAAAACVSDADPSGRANTA